MPAAGGRDRRRGRAGGTGQIPFTPNGKRDPRAGGVRVGRLDDRAVAARPRPARAPARRDRAARAAGARRSVAEARDEILGLREQPRHTTTGRARSAPSRAGDRDRGAPRRGRRAGPEHCCSASSSRCPSSRALRSAQPTAASCTSGSPGCSTAPSRPRQAPRRDIAVLEAALRSRRRSGSDEVSPADIMLGLLEVAPDVVARAAVDLDAVARGRAASPSVPPPRRDRAIRRRPGPLAVLEGARDMLARRARGGAAARPCLDRDRAPPARADPGRAGGRRPRARRPAREPRRGARPRRAHRPAWRRASHRGQRAGQIGFTPPSRASSAALREMAVRDRATEIDTGDILLAIERDGEGVAVQVLEQLGAPRASSASARSARCGRRPRCPPAGSLRAPGARSCSPTPRRARSATRGSAASTCCSRSCARTVVSRGARGARDHRRLGARRARRLGGSIGSASPSARPG